MIKTHPKISVDQIKHKPTKSNNSLDDHIHKLSNRKLTNSNNNRVVWDCGSSLYDSFERSSFQKQLDSAIVNSSRSFSMPRLPSQDRSAPLFKELQQPSQPAAKKQPVSPSKSITRSFQKLLKSVFRAHNRPKSSKANYDSSTSSPDPWFRDPVEAQEEKHKEFDDADGGRYYVVYDKRSVLSTIPEAPEVNYSPEIGSLVRKTMSERFTAASVGIHCA